MGRVDKKKGLNLKSFATRRCEFNVTVLEHENQEHENMFWWHSVCLQVLTRREQLGMAKAKAAEGGETRGRKPKKEKKDPKDSTEKKSKKKGLEEGVGSSGACEGKVEKPKRKKGTKEGEAEAPKKKRTKVQDVPEKASPSPKDAEVANKKQKTGAGEKEQNEENEELQTPPPRVLASVKALLQKARQDPAQWHHVKVLYKSLYDEVTPETLAKYKNWGLSMYWGKARVGLLCKGKHVLSFSNPFTSSISLPLKAVNLYVSCFPFSRLPFLNLLWVVASKNHRPKTDLNSIGW